jgi:hypothetical protein
MDVEYIPLETGGEFYCQGMVKAIGKEIMLVTNNTRDGDIFVFVRTGKGLRKINHLGCGPNEYIFIRGIVLDEDNGEIFVNDISLNKILVYDLFGKYRRDFRHKEGTSYTEIYSYNRDNLICYDGHYSADGESNEQTFLIISKQDGSIVKEIKIPYKDKKTTNVLIRNQANVVMYAFTLENDYKIIPHEGNFILFEPSSDTLYMYSPNHNMTPFIARTPSIQFMKPEVFLFPGIITEGYYFMEILKKEEKYDRRTGFPSFNLIYDKQEKNIFEYTVFNNDYSDKREQNMKLRPVNDEIAFWQKIEADQLVEDYEKGVLKGKLKEIAAKLKEEDNPVIMLVKHKK